jgi:hypothetical protein
VRSVAVGRALRMVMSVRRGIGCPTGCLSGHPNKSACLCLSVPILIGKW